MNRSFPARRFALVALVALTATSFTVTPVTALAGSVNAVVLVVEILSPRTSASVFSVIMFCTVGRVPLIAGRASVPLGGLIPKKLSKSVSVTP